MPFLQRYKDYISVHLILYLGQHSIIKRSSTKKHFLSLQQMKLQLGYIITYWYRCMVKLVFKSGLVIALNVFRWCVQYFRAWVCLFCEHPQLLLSLQIVLELFSSNWPYFNNSHEADVAGSSHRRKRSRSHSSYLLHCHFFGAVPSYSLKYQHISTNYACPQLDAPTWP